LLKESNEKKIVIASVPFVDTSTPLPAPAALKAAMLSQGLQCVGLDLNIEIYNKIQHHPKRQWFLDFFYRQIIREEIANELNLMLDFYHREIMMHNPDIVGLSLFSANSQVFTMWLCAMFRHRTPDVELIIGGPGLQTLENTLFKFPDRVKRLGLIDGFITGDDEQSLVEYVRGNKDFPGINSFDWRPVENFEQSAIPNYADYRLLKYVTPELHIIDSRGCVQDCEFCDVIAFWEKFQYLSAETIFQHMLSHIDTYGVYRFQLGSSICNGNLREFKKLVNLIADYNQQVNPQEEIYWMGSFIIRSASQHPESLWQAIKSSNGLLLTGVESITEKIRMGLGKKFTNADLDHHLNMAKKYQVPIHLLMIAVYHGETDKDIENTKQWFIDRKEFVNNPVQQIQLTLLSVLPGTKLEKNINQGITEKIKSNRSGKASELLKVLIQCGFNVRTFF
jgi:radical SAM superfamily enzyme YgiQ (UPF0313 family)